jgi:hypothetical protein
MGFVFDDSWDKEHKFLNDMRYAHDHASIFPNFINQFKANMIEIAKEYNLTFPFNLRKTTNKDVLPL